MPPATRRNAGEDKGGIPWAYDQLDRLVAVTLPDIDPADGITQPTLQYRYDAADRLTSETDGEGNVTSYVYCGCGRLNTIAEEDPTTRGRPWY